MGTGRRRGTGEGSEVREMGDGDVGGGNLKESHGASSGHRVHESLNKF